MPPTASARRRLDLLLTGLVALTALLPRLIGLTAFLTADEPKSWFGRSIQFLTALAQTDFAATFDSPAPGVTTMWAGSLGLLLEYVRQGFPGSLPQFLAAIPFDPLNPAILPLIRLPIVLVAVAAATLTWWWGRRPMGRPAALLAALLLALDPFLLGLTRILGHDGLVTLFMWLSLLAIINYQSSIINSTPNPSNSPFTIHHSLFLIISGLLGGLAFLTKYPSLFLGAFVAGLLLIAHLRSESPWRRWLPRWGIEVALWSIMAGLIFVLLWPAMWVDPVGRVTAIISDALRASGAPHPKGSFFFGQPVPDPGSSYYLLVTLFKTTPILWLGWLLALLGLLTGNRWATPAPGWRQTTLTVLAFGLLYGLLVTVGGKKQDRYIVPAFPALIALAALGYGWLWPILRQKSAALANGVWAGLVIAQAALVLPTAPYYFSYYNPLLGGGPAAARTVIVGWGEGLDLAAEWLNQQPNAANLDVVAWYSTTFEPYFHGHAIYKIDEEKISRTPKPGLAAAYVVLYVNQIQRQLPTAGALQYFQAEPPAHVVTINGLDYAWIYPSLKLQRVIAAESRLVGQAELQGFNLLDAAGRRLETIPADQPATIELYWEWQGKSPEDPIGLSLVDDLGQTWGWGHPLGTTARLPFEEWQDGMIAHDDFLLEIFPGTPPGDYTLKPWIDRPATGERVGDFPLTPEMRLTVTRPAAPPPVEALGLSKRLDAVTANGDITLLGLDAGEAFAAPWLPGEARTLRLYWQANRSIAGDLPLTLRLLEPLTGIIRAEWLGQPVAGRYPTGQWQPGEIVRDPWTLTLPANVPPGDYQLTAQLGQSQPRPLLAVSVEGRPRHFDLPPVSIPVGLTFGDGLELLGLQAAGDGQSITAAAGTPLTIAAIWRAAAPITTDYTLTAQLLNGQQRVIAQRDGVPLNGAAPTSSWTPGEVIADDLTLEVPPDAAPGSYSLLLAFYQPETGQRLRLPNQADHLTIPVILGR